MNIDELIEETLHKAAVHAHDDAYLCGAEFGCRYVLQRLAGVLVSEMLGLHKAAEDDLAAAEAIVGEALRP